uniref:Protein TEX261 n=1 Tax=Angiostrongylus cantonensis TaxID=6313 RepID=A0A0K0D9D4_ANGCA
MCVLTDYYVFPPFQGSCLLDLLWCIIDFSQDNPFVTFVFMQTLVLVVYHIELSFRLDLFSPFEFPYIYWFYGEVVCRWYMTSLEKSREVMKDTLKKGMHYHNFRFTLRSLQVLLKSLSVLF